MFALSLAIELNETNFDAFLAEKKRVMVKMTAPWCGHCKALAPVWQEIESDYKEVEFANIDCTANQALCGRYGVRGYPTIKFFLDGEVHAYEGARQKNAIITWVESMIKPQFEYKQEQECVEQAASRKQEQFFILFTNTLENPEFSQFKGQISFCAVEAPERKLVAHRDGDVIDYAGDFSAASLKEFVDTNKLSYLPQLSQETYGALATKNITTLVVDPTQHQAQIQQLRDNIKSIPAGEWTRFFNIAYIDGNHWEKYIETFKPHNRNDYPFVLVINPNDDKKYWSKALEGKPVQEVIVALHEEILAGQDAKNKDEL